MSDCPPELYEVWKLEFEYEDRPGIVKMRPVIIGANADGGDAVLIVKVTGHGPRKEYPGEIWIRDWKEAGLEKRSVARCSKSVIVPIEAFRSAELYGKLSQRDADTIAETLRSLGLTH